MLKADTPPPPHSHTPTLPHPYLEPLGISGYTQKKAVGERVKAECFPLLPETQVRILPTVTLCGIKSHPNVAFLDVFLGN